MANGAFGYDNRLLSGTLSAGSELAALPVSNLRNVHGNDAFAWRTVAGVVTSTGGGWFLLDFGATTTFRTFGLFRTNLTSAATVRWRVHSATIGAATVTSFDTGTLPGNVVAGYGQHIYQHSADVSGRYLRCDINDAANPDGFLAVALAYAGPVWIPSVNFAPSSSFIPARGQQSGRTRSGGTFLTPLYTERGWNVAYEAISPAELWTQLMPLELAAAGGANVLFVPDPASAYLTREAVYGLLETSGDVGFVDPAGTRRTWRAHIAERL